MGQADIATTAIYVHDVPQNVAADKLSRLPGAQRRGAVSPAAPDKLPRTTRIRSRRVG